MDSMVTAAARALRAGDPLGALKRIALRDDAQALALRGVALAQLGELARAKQLLRRAARVLAVPAARLIVSGKERPIRLEEVGDVLASKHLVIDACRRSVRLEHRMIALARRPVLFALVRALAESWPTEARREVLLLCAF